MNASRPPRPLLAGALAIGIVAAAAAVRFWALGQGLPFVMARPDEREALEHTIGFAGGDWNPHWFVYPNLFFWTIWGWEELALAVRRLWVPTPSYVTMLATDMPRLLLYGRALSALVGTATVALLYVIGRSAGGRRLGLLAAALLAGNFLHVRDSHALKSESFVTLVMLVGLWAVARYAAAPGPRRAAPAGVAIGVATAFKYPAILLLAAAWLADVLYGGARGWRRFVPHGHLLLLGATAVVAFLVCCPFFVLDFWTARDTALFVQQAIYASRTAPHAPPSATAAVAEFFRTRAFAAHLRLALRHGFGLAFALATPIALVLAWRRGTPPVLVLASAFSLFFYVSVGSSPVTLSRYVTPIAPFLTLLVAALVLWVADRVPRRGARPWIVVAGAVLLLAEPVASIAAWGRIASQTDTRVLATRWMAEHLRPGAVVAELGTIVFPISDPELPPGIVRPVLPLGATDLRPYGVTHVLTHEHQLPFSKLIPDQMQALTPHLRLLATFSPYRDGPAGSFEVQDAYYIPFYDFAGVERPGPLVRIYAYAPATKP